MAGQKSFRRKYNKIRWKFKGVYEQNLNLHLEEQKLVAVSRRLQEQNDQLLEALLDVNESDRVAKQLRYILDPPTESDVPDLQADKTTSNTQAEQILEEARQQVESGELMQRDYDILVAELKNSLKKPVNMRSLKKLEETVSHTSLDLLKDNQIPDDIKDEEFNTYLNATHEDAYLAQLDATIDSGGQVNGETVPQKPVLSEATLKNPVSTYNWLREHKPEVFVQEGGAAGSSAADKDKSDEKETSKGSVSTPAAAAIKRESRAVKRSSVVELLDDEGNLVGNYSETAAAPASKSKRKREVDDAYKPKGGGSSSSAKKRKKSTGTTTSASKIPDADADVDVD